MQVGEYLFSKIKALGVEHIFGIPGDFALPLFSAMEKAGLQIVVTTHEPSAGFAADAYARLRGFGVATVTFGAGGLNMVNSIAQAYAEKSPVLVISGAPEMQGRKLDVLFHHRVKTFESQLNVYKAVTGSAVALTDAASAGEEIDRVLAEVLRTKRPGYIEVPRDVARARIKKGARSEPAPLVRDQAALQEAMQEVVS
ncbi:MAG: thiamine pyrophosphate-binding protein, partial [Nitrospinota bacterium]